MDTKNPVFYSRVLWRADEAHARYRIPGMLVTAKGTLLAYCEARDGASDWARMDVQLQRSTDQGKSFDAPVLLARGNEAHKTVNNPVMVQDRNGRIHFLYCEDYGTGGGRICRRYSDDDGLSWSDKIDITSFTRPEERNAFAFGPGHGIQTADGTLLVPVWMVPCRYEAALQAHTPSVVSTFYSRDNGESWQLGDILDSTDSVVFPNETEAALTSDGRVYLSIRHMNTQRVKAYSPTGYDNWVQYAPEYALHDPCCFGSVVSFCDGKRPYTLFFANCDSKTDRTHVTVRASFDDGGTWPVRRLIDRERGGYVECASDSARDRIYVLYEEKAGEADHLVVFNYAWFLQDAGAEKTDE